MASFDIERRGWRRARWLVAHQRLTRADFDAVAAQLGVRPAIARKIAPVAASRAQSERMVETKWRGEETRNRARVGDWIVTNLDRNGQPLSDGNGNINQYVISAEKFEELYARTIGEMSHGSLFRARGTVDALPLPAGFDLVAPWGERQTGTNGYLIRNGDDIYGDDRKTFEQTYELVK